MRFFPTGRAARVRLAILVCVLIGVGYTFNAQAVWYRLGYAPQEGDIVFQSLPHAELVDAIEGVTRSPYSHCGVVLRSGERWMVIESLGNVHETPLLQWIARGRKGGFAVYRLDAKYKPVMPEFARQLRTYTGLLYDFDYEMSDKAIYCSELPYKAFQKTTGEELGKLEKLGNLDWKPFETFIKSVQEGRLPLDRLMITPVSLSRASQLKEVYRKGIRAP